MLPQLDAEYLRRFAGHSTVTDAGMICVVIPNFPIPKGMSCSSSDLLLRLASGYPDIPPDMWWFQPAVRRTDGLEIPATQHSETYLGRQWQRWSRHFAQGQWKSGIDSLESYLALVRAELEKAAATWA